MRFSRRLAEDLRRAVADMSFTLHYQPQVDIRTGQIEQFEALLRWRHPTKGDIPPDVFIPVAEDCGLIGRMGGWVLKQACAQAKTWPGRIGVAVNVSAKQFDTAELMTDVTYALASSGLNPSRLELEITETSLLKHSVNAATTIGRLRAIGVRVALDDFGTGYSSLSYLPNIPIDTIKIDRSFIGRMQDGKASIAIVRAIIALCRTLSVECVAEGVETPDQLAILTDEGCSRAQGYLMGAPCHAADIPAALAAPRARPRRRTPQRRSAAQPISFESIIASANDIVIVTTADLDPPGPIILYVNAAFTRLTGYAAHEAIGRSPRFLQGPGTSRVTLDAIAAGLHGGREVHEKVLNFSKSGAPYWLDLRIVPIRDATGAIYQYAAIERDVTLDKRRLDELEFAADRDTLTGIPNRRALLRTVNADLEAARSRGVAGPSLAFIDVDHFKRVNDQYGHATGDAVLFGVADRLAENVRRIDMVGRVGGEEFAVCMPALRLPEAAAIGERLRHAVAAEPFETPSGPIRITISVGVSEADTSGRGADDLMRRADGALYRAKQQGRDRVETHPPRLVALG